MEIEEVEPILEIEEEAVPTRPTGQLLGLRILMMIGLPFILAFASLAFSISLIAALFRRNLAAKAWRYTCVASALATGCFVSIFSPRFGITIICTYFVLRAESADSGFLASLRSRFDQAASHMS